MLLVSILSFSQSPQPSDSTKDYSNIKNMELYDFLNLLEKEENQRVKDSILNIYFNSQEYLNRRIADEKISKRDSKELKKRNTILQMQNNTMNKRIERYKDSVDAVSHRFLSNQLKTLQKKAIVSAALGVNTLSPSVQVSILKNFSKYNLSFWGILLGFQQNYEDTAPILFGIQNFRKFQSKNFYHHISLWTSGIRENPLAVQVDAKYRKILRANTYGGCYGIGKMLKSKNKFLSFGVTLQKYTVVFDNDDGIESYTTNLAIGVSGFLTFVIGKKSEITKL